MRDLREASAIEEYMVPKIYVKQYYCIDAAVHQRLVRVRKKKERRNRHPPSVCAGNRARMTTRKTI